jgi:hypothetical protein
MNLREHSTFGQFVAVYEKNVAEFKSLEAQLAAAEGDKDSAVTAFMESSDDDQAVRIRERLAELAAQQESLRAKFREYADSHVHVQELDADSKAKLASQLTDARKEVKNSLKAFEILTSTLAQPELDAAMVEYLKDHPDPTAKRAPNTGASLPKYPCTIDITVSTKPETVIRKENISTAAPFVGLNVRQLGEEIAKAGGVEYANLSTLHETVELDIPGGQPEVTYHLVVTPKPRKPRGQGTDQASTSADGTDADPQAHTPAEVDAAQS